MQWILTTNIKRLRNVGAIVAAVVAVAAEDLLHLKQTLQTRIHSLLPENPSRIEQIF